MNVISKIWPTSALITGPIKHIQIFINLLIQMKKQNWCSKYFKIKVERNCDYKSPKISKCFSWGCLSFIVLKVASVYSLYTTFLYLEPSLFFPVPTNKLPGLRQESGYQSHSNAATSTKVVEHTSTFSPQSCWSTAIPRYDQVSSPTASLQHRWNTPLSETLILRDSYSLTPSLYTAVSSHQHSDQRLDSSPQIHLQSQSQENISYI